MKRPRFGRDEPAPTREELEREAARELERMTRQAGGPPPSGGASGWSSTPPPPASAPSSFQPRFGGGGGAPAAPTQPSVRERFQARDVEEMDEEDDDEGDYSEEEMVTELALRDWSERSGRGRSIEDLALPRIDPASVEAQRDRALREFTERQARMERESEAARIQRQAMGLNPPSRAGTVNLTAARPMGMLNLSAQAAGMRNQGSGGSTVTEGPIPKASRKPTKAKAKVAGTSPSDAGVSGARTPKKAPKKAANDAMGRPAAKAAPRTAKTKAVAPPVPVKAAKAAGGTTTTEAAKATAKRVTKASTKATAEPVNKPSAKATAKPVTKPVAKAPTKAPKVAAKTVGKATKAAAPASATKATAGKGKKAPAASAAPPAKKAPAKASPSPRKGSGRR